jgi:hypothetical protein
MSNEFKVGQRWLMRNGDVAIIETIDRTKEFPVVYSYRWDDGRERRTARLDGRYSDRQESQFDLVELLDKSANPQPQLELSDYLRMSRDDLVSQAQRFIEIADSVATKRNWESVVKLKMLKAMLQQVIEHEGTL